MSKVNNARTAISICPFVIKEFKVATFARLLYLRETTLVVGVEKVRTREFIFELAESVKRATHSLRTPCVTIAYFRNYYLILYDQSPNRRIIFQVFRISLF